MSIGRWVESQQRQQHLPRGNLLTLRPWSLPRAIALPVNSVQVHSHKFYSSTMPKPRHKVHEVDEEVLQGVWTRKCTSRRVKTMHTAIPGVQGPPSPSKMPASPVKPNAQGPPSPNPLMEEHYDFKILDPASHPFSRGKVCGLLPFCGRAQAVKVYPRHKTTTLGNFRGKVRDF